MQLRLGDTLLNVKAGANAPPSHLWLIVSDPSVNAESVVMVNFTSKGSSLADETVVLKEQDHPSLKHDSCVNFEDAKSPSLAQLENLLRRGLVVKKPPLDIDTVMYIQEELLDHPSVSEGIKSVVRAQIV